LCSLQDWLCRMATLSADEKEEQNQHFKEVDKNHDGKLDIKELSHYLRRYTRRLSKKNQQLFVQAIKEQLDAVDPTKTDRIDFDTFQKAFYAANKNTQKPRRPELFVEDENGRIRIDREKVDYTEDNFGFPKEINKILTPATAKKYKHRGKYKPFRLATHAFVKSVILRVEKTLEGEDKIAIFMGGGTASGKTTLLRKMGSEQPDLLPQRKYAKIDPDMIKMLMPEVRHAPDADAMTTEIVNVHQESNDVVDDCLRQAAEAGISVFVDGTMSSLPTVKKRVRIFRRRGYKIGFVGLTIDPIEALLRCRERYYQTGRLVPAWAVLASHKGFNENISFLMERANFGYVYGDDGELWMSKKANEEVKVHQPSSNAKIFARSEIKCEQLNTLRDLKLQMEGAYDRYTNPISEPATKKRRLT